VAAAFTTLATLSSASTPKAAAGDGFIAGDDFRARLGSAFAADDRISGPIAARSTVDEEVAAPTASGRGRGLAIPVRHDVVFGIDTVSDFDGASIASGSASQGNAGKQGKRNFTTFTHDLVSTMLLDSPADCKKFRTLPQGARLLYMRLTLSLYVQLNPVRGHLK
jgi:hypothetical protein